MTALRKLTPIEARMEEMRERLEQLRARHGVLRAECQQRFLELKRIDAEINEILRGIHRVQSFRGKAAGAA